MRAPNRGARREAERFALPPFGSYDPAIEEEIRATEAGLRDFLEELRIEGRLARRDKRRGIRTIRRGARRGRQDIGRRVERGLADIREGREDVLVRAGRGEEDFRDRLRDLTRTSERTGIRHAEAANVAGVSGGGTLLAAADIRARNLAEARESLDVARARLQEDTRRDVGRLGRSEAELREDAARARTRLGQNVRQERRGVRREYRIGRRERGRQKQRQRREAFFRGFGLRKQAIFQARQLNPGAFSRYGKRRNRRP